jgi:hypothetical protein
MFAIRKVSIEYWLACVTGNEIAAITCLTNVQSSVSSSRIECHLAFVSVVMGLHIQSVMRYRESTFRLELDRECFWRITLSFPADIL